MYAVIRTGGKQYRVQPGDLLVVEKLDGEPGAAVAFEEVLMLGGEGAALSVGAPLIEGARVSATLIETRKGEKIKIFKKRRRKGYRRTGGHRQLETVLRVLSIAGGGDEAKWDGEVDLTPLAVLNERARNLARGADAARTRSAERVARKAARSGSGASSTALDVPPETAAVKAAPKAKTTSKAPAAPKATAGKPAAKAAAPQVEPAPAAKPAAKKASVPKAAATSEAPKAAAAEAKAPKAAAKPKTPKAKIEE